MQSMIQRFFALVICANISACSTWKLEPWVKPYERENIADPIMSFESNPAATKYMGHVIENRESARGAEGGAGGGCGCN